MNDSYGKSNPSGTDWDLFHNPSEGSMHIAYRNDDLPDPQKTFHNVTDVKYSPSGFSVGSGDGGLKTLRYFVGDSAAPEGAMPLGSSGTLVCRGGLPSYMTGEGVRK